MEVSTSNARLGPSSQAHGNDSVPQYPIKDELDGDGDVFTDLESEEYDPAVYKPRPQLPSPHVHMRSLKSLISKRYSNNARRVLDANH